MRTIIAEDLKTAYNLRSNAYNHENLRWFPRSASHLVVITLIGREYRVAKTLYTSLLQLLQACYQSRGTFMQARKKIGQHFPVVPRVTAVVRRPFRQNKMLKDEFSYFQKSMSDLNDQSCYLISSTGAATA